MMQELKQRLQTKTEDGITYYFYAGLGWVTEERLSQPDIQEIEAYKKFMSDPANSHNCGSCPENKGYNGKLPCGQQNCWVDCHCEMD